MNDFVSLRPVTNENWRAVAQLEVFAAQQRFVADPSYYLALCCYGELWQPLAVYAGERIIGFLMWAVDPADGSCWLGGILIDRHQQRRGYGRQAVQTAIEQLHEQHGFQQFALSYAPDNPAKQLYTQLGFTETGEREDEELVARLLLRK